MADVMMSNLVLIRTIIERTRSRVKALGDNDFNLSNIVGRENPL